MTAGHRGVFAKVVICALLITAAEKPANADQLTEGSIVGIGIAVGAIGAGIGFGIYYAVHHNSSVTGCAVSGSSGLEMQVQGDQRSYSLIGDVADIKPGHRVHLSGKKEKEKSGAPRQFLVEKVGKDYGQCQAR